MKRLLSLAALLLAFLVAGCSVGPVGEQTGGVSLTVTDNFGQKVLLQTSQEEFPEAETVMRYLQRNADIDTRYGGRFVSAIDGVEEDQGGQVEWFYYVNGLESEQGAAERRLSPGDHVWWDRHTWKGSSNIPAVAGLFPEPFKRGDGKRFPVRIDCGQDSEASCKLMADKLRDAGIPPSVTVVGSIAGENVLRFLVGTWDEIRDDKAARLLEEGPRRSGVFARVDARGEGVDIELLGPDGEPVRTLGPGSGIVAPTQGPEQRPTWIVTGTDRAGIDAAIGLVERRKLRNRFAIASDAGRPVSLPVQERERP